MYGRTLYVYTLNKLLLLLLLSEEAVKLIGSNYSLYSKV